MVLTSNTAIFLCTLESPWTEHSPTNNTLKKWKEKVRTRNNLLHKLANSSWGANTSTLRATALALCYSVAEYACPVWGRSSHAKKVDASLNDSCRCITGCLRPTNVDSLYVLAGIAPPGVRRSVASRTERRRQADDTRHPCHNHQPAPSRLKSRKSFLHAVQPLSQPPQTARLTLWECQMWAHTVQIKAIQFSLNFNGFPFINEHKLRDQHFVSNVTNQFRDEKLYIRMLVAYTYNNQT